VFSSTTPVCKFMCKRPAFFFSEIMNNYDASFVAPRDARDAAPKRRLPASNLADLLKDLSTATILRLLSTRKSGRVIYFCNDCPTPHLSSYRHVSKHSTKNVTNAITPTTRCCKCARDYCDCAISKCKHCSGLTKVLSSEHRWLCACNIRTKKPVVKIIPVDAQGNDLAARSDRIDKLVRDNDMMDRTRTRVKRAGFYDGSDTSDEEFSEEDWYDMPKDVLISDMRDLDARMDKDHAMYCEEDDHSECGVFVEVQRHVQAFYTDQGIVFFLKTKWQIYFN